jgi:hypothetical protein
VTQEPKAGELYTLRIRPAWEEGLLSGASVGSIVKVVEAHPGKVDEARFTIQAADGGLAIVPLVFLVDLAEGNDQ